MRLAAEVGRAAAAAMGAAGVRGAAGVGDGLHAPPPLAAAAAAGGSSYAAGAAGVSPLGSASAPVPGSSGAASAAAAERSSSPDGSRVAVPATRSRSRGKGKKVVTPSRAVAPPAVPSTQELDILPMMDDTTASLAAATASTLTTEAGGRSAGSTVPPVARGAAEALPLPDGGVYPVAVHGPPDEPARPDRIVAALSTAPPPSLHEEPPLSSSARTAKASAPGPSGGSARAAPLADAAVAGQAPPSLSSAPAVGFSSGAATSARGADMLAEAVARGISPLREDLQRFNTALGELTQEVRHLRMGHETLARGHERVVMTMTVVRGDISKAFDDLTVSFESLSTKVGRGVGATEASDASSKVAVIKQLARSRLTERTGSATTSKDVCISTSRSWEEYVGLAAGVLGVDKADASSWLLAYCDMPARKGASEVKSVRRCTPILRIKAHVMYQWKDVVTSAYFSALGISRQEITRQKALLLLAGARIPGRRLRGGGAAFSSRRRRASGPARECGRLQDGQLLHWARGACDFLRARHT